MFCNIPPIISTHLKMDMNVEYKHLIFLLEQSVCLKKYFIEVTSGPH